MNQELMTISGLWKSIYRYFIGKDIRMLQQHEI